ncbi:(R)-limonene synthase, putative [Ricinus communis]|uniref:Probable terpene synthase 12 n=1 Tax=Ricinus communis TaxID=3988 RepID=TPS12_RICCO|nr:RecName: Full=Probable terpene synthase 12; Short=RcSeTPS12 [Ricinus communis]EEF27987.1 (R)-limonene synthase, putative [Ricinus communis]|eukprot:XP_002534394.1 probable terpene synthase 12 [Ricinus communis]
MAINLFKVSNFYTMRSYVSPHVPVPNVNLQSVSCSAKAELPHLRPVIKRRSANYPPTIWTYNFVQSLNNHNADVLYKEKARKLEEEVRRLINNESQEMLTTLELIDGIQRLGLAYLFEKDIKGALDRFVSMGGCHVLPRKSLHAIALSFRLLRQHGYEVYQDDFKDFMDQKGELLKCFKKDVQGILSFYEASFCNLEGEDLLEKAKTETKVYLNDLQRNSKSDTVESISHALELPLCRRMVMLEARWYIEAYNKREDSNYTLLELAKLNFNMAQSILQRDLKDMSRWWNNLGLANKLSFSRDRLMECFFWTIGMAFEPQFSSCRKGLTKVTSLITTIDDVYDVYGTLDELEVFTDAVERWDVNAVRDLPNCMQLSFLALYNTINEMAYETLKEQGEHIIPYLTKAWADLCKAFLQEARWSHSKCIPSFDDYVENGWRSASGNVILVHAYFLLGHNSKQALDSLLNYHDILRWPSVVFRLCNDLATSSDELNRGETANSISCYMFENRVSEEQAREQINKLIDKAWTKMNEYHIGATHFGEPFIEAAINVARIPQCIYRHGDDHGAPDSRSKERVWSLIIESISLVDS